jgi:hypothetical protein
VVAALQKDPFGYPKAADEEDREEHIDDDDRTGHGAVILPEKQEESDKKGVGEEVGFDNLFKAVKGKKTPGGIIDVKIKKGRCFNEEKGDKKGEEVFKPLDRDIEIKP